MNSLTRDEVRAVDRAAIDGLGIPGLILMENAGRNCADAIEDFFSISLGGKNSRNIAIVAGPGNNGGDGYVIARHLAMRGFRVITWIICPAEKISGDAAVNLRAITALQHDIRFLTSEQLTGLSASLAEFDVVIDAIGGTGIRGPLRGDAAIAVEQINAAGRAVVAVDIPTGLDCDTGRADGGGFGHDSHQRKGSGSVRRLCLCPRIPSGLDYGCGYKFSDKSESRRHAAISSRGSRSSGHYRFQRICLSCRWASRVENRGC